MRVSYPFVNCFGIILPETEQVAAQPNSSAHAWRPRLRPQGKSTVFVSSAFCCRLCDRAEIPDRVALSRTSDVVQPRGSILTGPLATGRAMARHGVKEQRDRRRPAALRN